jgi:hypothetical protein
MNDVVGRGMYRGANTTKTVSIDRRYVKITDSTGVVQDLPLMSYVAKLEREILALRAEATTRDAMIERMEAQSRRTAAALKKIEARLR